MIGNALRAGAPTIQLREKQLPPREILPLARHLRQATLAHEALFFVNDRLDLALAVKADGVHLGPDDLPVCAARQVAPGGFLIGFSSDDPLTARKAIADGANYVGCGTVYATSTKSDAGKAIGLSRLRDVASAIDAPVVGIGGITPDRAPDVFAAGATGCAAVSAIMAATDPGLAVRRLLAAERK